MAYKQDTRFDWPILRRLDTLKDLTDAVSELLSHGQRNAKSLNDELLKIERSGAERTKVTLKEGSSAAVIVNVKSPTTIPSGGGGESPLKFEFDDNGRIIRYDNVIPLFGKHLIGNGVFFSAEYPGEAQNSILQPVGICPPINATSVRSVSGAVSLFVYVGRIPSPISTIDVLYKVTTAGVTPVWAEIGIFKGAVVFNGNASLARLGYTDISGVETSTGVKRTTVALSGVAVGDDLWIAIGGDWSTNPEIRATVADEIQQGVSQLFSGRISTMPDPSTTTLASSTALTPWLIAKW